MRATRSLWLEIAIGIVGAVLFLTLLPVVVLVVAGSPWPFKLAALLIVGIGIVVARRRSPLQGVLVAMVMLTVFVLVLSGAVGGGTGSNVSTAAGHHFRGS